MAFVAKRCGYRHAIGAIGKSDRPEDSRGRGGSVQQAGFVLLMPSADNARDVFSRETFPA